MNEHVESNLPNGKPVSELLKEGAAKWNKSRPPHLHIGVYTVEEFEIECERDARMVNATPFVWRDPAKIPPRQWLYGRDYIRKFITATVAPAGVGKSSLVIVEALSIATLRPLLGVTPSRPTSGIGMAKILRMNLSAASLPPCCTTG